MIEGAVERIIEDVLTIVDSDWEMMAAVLVRELDAVRGVIGIRDFTLKGKQKGGCACATK